MRRHRTAHPGCALDPRRSFGYKHGLPASADFVFDVRCLPNPYWEPKLRPLSGKDEPVRNFLNSQPIVQQMVDDIVAFLEDWIPRYQDFQRSYLTVAIGCTGGCTARCTWPRPSRSGSRPNTGRSGRSTMSCDSWPPSRGPRATPVAAIATRRAGAFARGSSPRALRARVERTRALARARCAIGRLRGRRCRLGNPAKRGRVACCDRGGARASRRLRAGWG